MAKQPIVLNGVEFKFQKDAIEYFKCMLNRYGNGETVTEFDSDVLMSLLERHPKADKKIGCGVKRFYKDRTDMPTSCFWVERKDGSKTDFSYLTALRAKSKSLYQEFMEACRNSVKDDLRLTKMHFFEKYADKNGKVECDITGEKIAFNESHIDHKKPLTFQVLVNTFIAANDIQIIPEMFSHQDAQFQTTFTDPDLKGKFVRYHHKVAQLRIIKAKLNLSLGGSERILKSRNPAIIPAELLDK